MDEIYLVQHHWNWTKHWAKSFSLMSISKKSCVSRNMSLPHSVLDWEDPEENLQRQEPVGISEPKWESLTKFSFLLLEMWGCGTQSHGHHGFINQAVLWNKCNQAISHASASFPQRLAYEVTFDQWYFQRMFPDITKLTLISLRVHTSRSNIV